MDGLACESLSGRSEQTAKRVGTCRSEVKRTRRPTSEQHVINAPLYTITSLDYLSSHSTMAAMLVRLKAEGDRVPDA